MCLNCPRIAEHEQTIPPFAKGGPGGFVQRGCVFLSSDAELNSGWNHSTTRLASISIFLNDLLGLLHHILSQLSRLNDPHVPVPAHNPIADLLENWDKAHAEALAARPRIEAVFGWRPTAERTLACYERVISEFHSGKRELRERAPSEGSKREFRERAMRASQVEPGRPARSTSAERSEGGARPPARRAP